MSGLRKKLKLPLPRAFILVAAVSLALSAAFFALASYAGSGLYDQRAAEYWGGAAAKAKPSPTPTPEETETPDETAAIEATAASAAPLGSLKASEMGYSQVSAFLAKGTRFGYESMMRLRQGLEEKYIADGIEAEKDGARLWIDAASGTGSAAVTGGKAGSSAVTVTGIMGDFFFFHPAKLVSGQYINTSEASKDYVMLDLNAAWRVFGGYDVAGMTVEVGGIPCVVAGVFEKPSGDEAESSIYASFELLEKISPAAELTALDFVLSTPISGYGIQAVEGLLTAVPAAERVLIENSLRFTRGSMLAMLGDLGTYVERKNAVALPYWENAAREEALRGAVFLLLSLVFAALPLIAVIILLAKLYRRRGLFLPWVIRKAKAIGNRGAADAQNTP
jgi:hypothetical protein